MARKQKTIHYLYKTTCLVTNRYYIGMHSTCNIDDGYMGSGKRLRYSIRKYGVDILIWIKEHKSKAYISKKLNCKQDTLNKHLKQMCIEYAGNMCGKGIHKNKVSLQDILSNKVKFNTSHLKKRLVIEGLLEDKCIDCNNNGMWNGKPITLELDHINGDDNDNRLENLRILCPNCHSQTPTFRKKKIKKDVSQIL